MDDEFKNAVLTVLADLRRGQANLQEGQADLQRGQANLQEGQADLQRGQADLQRGQADLHGGLTGLHTNVSEHRAETTAMRAAIMERIDRLQDALTQTKDDLLVTSGMTDRLWRAIAADRDKVEIMREVITVLQRKISNLEDRINFGP